MSRDSDDSDALLERLQAGETEALAALFSAHRERLWRMVYFRLDERLAGRVDADDVLQEAYINAGEKVPSFLESRDMSFALWLRLVVGQTLIDVHRRHLGAKMRDAGREVALHGGGAPMASSASMSAHLVAELLSPSQTAMRAEAQVHLQRALDGMDPIDREVLVLRHFEELGNNEVAEILGLQKSAASNRYIRALARLKRILAEDAG